MNQTGDQTSLMTLQGAERYLQLTNATIRFTAEVAQRLSAQMVTADSNREGVVKQKNDQ